MKKRILVTLTTTLLLILNIQAFSNEYLDVLNNKTTISTQKNIQKENGSISKTQNQFYLLVDESKKLFKENKLQEAKLKISKALEIVPTSTKALKLRAEIEHKLNENIDALKDIDKAIYVNSSDELYNLRGQINLSMENYSASIEDFSNAIKLNSNNYVYYYRRGFASYMTAKRMNNPTLFEDSIKDLDDSINLNPENISSYFYRGMAKREIYGDMAGLDDIQYAINEYKNKEYKKDYNKAIEIYSLLNKDYLFNKNN